MRLLFAIVQSYPLSTHHVFRGFCPSIHFMHKKDKKKKIDSIEPSGALPSGIVNFEYFLPKLNVYLLMR
jgi:hypothetical protein